MIETRHGLESNPVPTSIFAPKRAMMAIKLKMDVGTGLDSRPCLVSIIFADLTSLHPPSFQIFIHVAPIFSSTARARCASHIVRVRNMKLPRLFSFT